MFKYKVTSEEEDHGGREDSGGVRYEEWVLMELRTRGMDMMSTYYNRDDAYNQGGSVKGREKILHIFQLPRRYIHEKEEEGNLVEVNNNAEQVKDKSNITNKSEEDGQRWEENKADYTH